MCELIISSIYIKSLYTIVNRRRYSVHDLILFIFSEARVIDEKNTVQSIGNFQTDSAKSYISCNFIFIFLRREFFLLKHEIKDNCKAIVTSLSGIYGQPLCTHSPFRTKILSINKESMPLYMHIQTQALMQFHHVNVAKLPTT